MHMASLPASRVVAVQPETTVRNRIIGYTGDQALH